MVAIIGDVHGRFEDVFRIFRDNPTVSHFFQIGDLGAEDVGYPDFPSNFHFIHGNHENWVALLSLMKKSGLYLRNGFVYSFVDISGRKEIPFTVGVLGGNYSPKFYYQKRDQLSGSRIRHFVEEELNNLLFTGYSMDIFLSHEAPSPFAPRNVDIGQPLISAVIKHNSPGIHFFGHHHIMKTMEVHGTRSIGLGYAKNDYVLYDLNTKRMKTMVTQ